MLPCAQAATRIVEANIFALPVRPGEGADKSHTWIVDPLDGTTNFLHGIPHFAISIGLQREGTMIAGLIYNPANDDLYIAERGKDALLNDQRLRALDMAYIAAERRSRSPDERSDIRERRARTKTPGIAALTRATDCIRGTVPFSKRW